MDTGLGQRLSGLVADAGFEVTDVARCHRHVTGNSSEVNFHELSVRQLATAVKNEDAESTARLERFADCFKDEELEYL